MADDESKPGTSGQTCVFVKPKSRRANALRKRQESSDDSDEGSSVQKKDRKKLNGLMHTSASSKKWKTDDETVAVSFSSAKQKAGPSDQGATATVEIDTEIDKDARSIFERAQKINEELKGKEDDKVYRGVNNYTQYIQKKDSAAGSAAKTKAKGPLRAPTNVRSTVRWDYQPDVCKDYKETGYCGFGDSCIFMHDRSDYKHGWQMDRDWEQRQKLYDRSESSRRLHEDSDDSSDDGRRYEVNDDSDEYSSQSCSICKQDFVNPVSTKCNHIFCEKCVIAHFKKTHKCFVCEKPTGGTLQVVRDSKPRKTYSTSQPSPPHLYGDIM